MYSHEIMEKYRGLVNSYSMQKRSIPVSSINRHVLRYV